MLPVWKQDSNSGIKLEAIRALYESNQAAVRIYERLTQWFNIGSGVKQGCVMSLRLFSLYMDVMLCRALNADDVPVTSVSEEQLERMIWYLRVFIINEHRQSQNVSISTFWLLYVILSEI